MWHGRPARVSSAPNTGGSPVPRYNHLTMETGTSHPSPQDTDWFREPTRREHGIAACLFIFFGLFFLALFVVVAGWWFRWVIAGLGVYSILHGAGHVRAFLRRRRGDV